MNTLLNKENTQWVDGKTWAYLSTEAIKDVIRANRREAQRIKWQKTPAPKNYVYPKERKS